MRLGVLTDLHEAVELLSAAIAGLRDERVDRILFLGDIVETGERVDESVALLAGAGIECVWGNHDFGIVFPDAVSVVPFSQATRDWGKTMCASLRYDDCHFSHVGAACDPQDIAAMWLTGEEKAPEHFAACDARVMFAGHLHRWRARTPDGTLAWAGSEPLRVTAPNRYFITVAPLFGGHFGVYDTQSMMLHPHRVAPGTPGASGLPGSANELR